MLPRNDIFLSPTNYSFLCFFSECPYLWIQNAEKCSCSLLCIGTLFISNTRKFLRGDYIRGISRGKLKTICRLVSTSQLPNKNKKRTVTVTLKCNEFELISLFRPHVTRVQLYEKTVSHAPMFVFRFHPPETKPWPHIPLEPGIHRVRHRFFYRHARSRMICGFPLITWARKSVH